MAFHVTKILMAEVSAKFWAAPKIKKKMLLSATINVTMEPMVSVPFVGATVQ